MKRFFHIILVLLLLAGFLPQADASINMTVSPIKYEIEVNPGDLITKTATLFNYSSNTLNINTSTAEFISDGVSGKPVIIRPENSTSVASWVTLHTESFTIDPNGERTISFDIFVPDNATPGGHYGAVFFENDYAGYSPGTNIGIDADYGVLLLINVSGDIIIDGGIGDTTVNTGGSSGGYSSIKKDSCPLGDFSKSNFDGKCIDSILGDTNDDSEENNSNEQDENSDLGTDINTGDNTDNGENNTDEKDENSDSGTDINSGDNTNNNNNNSSEDDLDITFEIPFENKGNTHIKPKGQIILKDENNRQIPNIGKEVILNENGAIIGERIVDYIPINDIGGNVLPQTQRVFEGEWKGFPYKDRNLKGEEVVNYWNPGEYYTFQNIPENKVLNFWERTLQRTNTKKIEAEIQVSYIDINGEEVEFNSAEEFYIEYVDTYIGINKYIVALGIFGILFIFFFIIVKRKRKKKCIECEKKIDKDLKICPYCETKQEEKKKKKKKKKKKS